MKKRVTQHDVAREAGVSRQLVSLVVQNDPRVSPESRKAIEEAIEKLGYRPNAAAQTLASNITGNLGLLLRSYENPFFGEFAESFTKACSERGLTAIVSVSLQDPDREVQALERFAQMRVDGLALVSPMSDFSILEKQSQLMSVCLVSNNQAPPGADLVHTDDYVATRLLTHHLIEQGYERVIFMGAQQRIQGDTTQERAEGYRTALREAGREHEMAIVTVPGTSGNSAESSETAHRILDRYGKGIAVVCHNDLMAIEMIMAIHARGWTPGVDVGVTGFDNTRLSSIPELAITSVDQQRDEIAKAAVDLLVKGARAVMHRQKRILLEPHLVIRKSSQKA